MKNGERASLEARMAPTGAERWFYAPRNLDVPAPSNSEIVATPAGAGGDGVAAYSGVGLPPAADSLIARGGLFHYENGMLFLPFPPAEAESWLEGMRPALDFAIGRGLETFLPLGIFAGAALEATIGEALFGRHDQEEAERVLKARWEHPGVLVVPIVNIVEASCCSVRGRGLFPKRTGYLAVTTQNAGGREVSRTFSFAGSREGVERLPAALFTARIGRELEFYTARAKWKLTGYDFDARLRAGLAKLGLDVIAPEVTLESVIEAVKRASEAGHNITITVGQFCDTVTEIENAAQNALNEAKQRLGNQWPQEMCRLILADLEPMLPHYRRVPAMAHQIEVMERVAAGETNRDWTPTWRPEAYHFNFPPSVCPPQVSK
jgi:hypothetical protein